MFIFLVFIYLFIYILRFDIFVNMTLLRCLHILGACGLWKKGVISFPSNYIHFNIGSSWKNDGPLINLRQSPD